MRRRVCQLWPAQRPRSQFRTGLRALHIAGWVNLQGLRLYLLRANLCFSRPYAQMLQCASRYSVSGVLGNVSSRLVIVCPPPCLLSSIGWLRKDKKESRIPGHPAWRWFDGSVPMWPEFTWKGSDRKWMVWLQFSACWQSTGTRRIRKGSLYLRGTAYCFAGTPMMLCTIVHAWSSQEMV